MTVRFGVVLGFPRSGGTLLRRILDQHADISCPPEPWLTTACARFLQDVPTDVIPIGVRTGLGFGGIAEEEVTAALRDVLFGMHRRMAGDKPVWIEKSGFDVFHLAPLTDLIAGHGKFICVVRHPLDVVASNLDLAQRMGRYMPELQPWLAAHAAPVVALAEAWADRTVALLDFAADRDDTVVIRFEDLLADPVATLGGVFDLMGVARMTLPQVEAALVAPTRVGLGDWKTLTEARLTQGPVGRWQKSIPRRVAGQVMARLGPVMQRAGYDPVPVPRQPSRDEAIRQFGAAARLAARPQGHKP